MSVNFSTLYPYQSRYPITDDNGIITPSFRQWLLSVSNLIPLNTVDTTTGAAILQLPPAGQNQTTGESNQNVELIYRKVSPDGNTVTIQGSEDGDQFLTTGDGAPTSYRRFKSDGTNWWVVG